MTILDPRHFLRVEEKFLPAFAFFDDALDTPGLLSVYVALWHFACKRERPTQVELARCSKCGLRALQNNLSTLSTRGYVAIHKESGRNFYDLILSPRVVSEFLRQGVEFQNSFYADQAGLLLLSDNGQDAQNLRIGHAKSAPPLKNLKRIKKNNTPLSPLPNGPAPDHAGMSRDGSLRPACLAQGSGEFCPTGQSGHSDQSLSSPCRPTSPCGDRANPSPRGTDWSESSLSADFAKLWAVWPVHQAEVPAKRVFASLARRGVLPSVDTLLTAIERLKAHDFRWRDGGRFVPQLSHWLRDERWRDEPVTSLDSATVAQPISGAPADVTTRQEDPFDYSIKEKPTISAKTLAQLAASPWMSKQALANLQAMQAHCTETISHEQGNQGNNAPEDASRYGQGRVSGLPARDPDHAGERLHTDHDLHQPEKCRESKHHLQAVLAVFDRTNWHTVSPSAVPSFAGFASFAPEKAASCAYVPT